MEECRFLADVNLPRFSSLWNNAQYIHQADLGDKWSLRLKI